MGDCDSRGQGPVSPCNTLGTEEIEPDKDLTCMLGLLVCICELQVN